jgi:hypothetical protein
VHPSAVITDDLLAVALLALVLYPVMWLLSLPFRIVSIAVGGVFDLLGPLIARPNGSIALLP